MVDDAQLELAQKLRRLRELSGMSTHTLARQTGLSQSKISRIERGLTRPLARDVDVVLDSIGVAESIRTSLVDDALDLGRLQDTFHPVMPAIEQLQALTNMFRDASNLRHYVPFLVHALLQTPEYMIAMHRIDQVKVDLPAYMHQHLQRQADAHMSRTEHQFVIGEASLHNRVLPAHLHLAQLEFLLSKLLSKKLNIGIIPLDADVALLPETNVLFDNDSVFTEHRPHCSLSTRKTDVETTATRFEASQKVALWGADAERLIKQLIKRLDAVDD